ncbi:Ppx/GppA phosphatase family protein [Magnetococcales bacterium HHB-1]
MKLAAIDIGSNSSKLLISKIYEVGEWAPVIRKVNFYRVPLRLGEDAFIDGHISYEKISELIKTLSAFRNLMEVNQVEDHIAFATSALRLAQNSRAVLERVRRETGIQIQMFDGAREAEILALNQLTQRLPSGSYLYIDVGGGTTELTLNANGRTQKTGSFDIGLVRMKRNLVTEQNWNKLKNWIRTQNLGPRPLFGIGSGGNITKVFELTRKHSDKPLTIEKLRQLRDALAYLSPEERVLRLGLSPDRADVIVDACDVFLSVMSWAGIHKIFVPKVGLSDGMIHYLYQSRQKNSQKTRHPPL